MSEMALTASHLIVVGQGRLIADSSVEELTRTTARDSVLVRTDEGRPATRPARHRRGAVTTTDDAGLHVTGLTSVVVGRIAAQAGIALAELTPQRASLEEAFMEITRDSVEFDAAVDPRHAPWRPPDEHPDRRQPAAARSPRPGISPPRVTKAEWIKFRSLRSTWYSLGAAMFVAIGLGILFADLRGNDIANHGGFKGLARRSRTGRR